VSEKYIASRTAASYLCTYASHMKIMQWNPSFTTRYRCLILSSIH